MVSMAVDMVVGMDVDGSVGKAAGGTALRILATVVSCYIADCIENIGDASADGAGGSVPSRMVEGRGGVCLYLYLCLFLSSKVFIPTAHTSAADTYVTDIAADIYADSTAVAANTPTPSVAAPLLIVLYPSR
jgi:hypothetical protein